MWNFASAIAVAAFAIGAVTAGPAFAAVEPNLGSDVAAPAGDIVEIAYGCDFVIFWDAYGNYYEYICY